MSMKEKTNFQRLVDKVKNDQPMLHERSLQSLDWFKNKISKEFGTKSESPLNVYDTKVKKTVQFSGQLMTFQYFPKNKKTLPFYDMYPLILTIDMDPTSILGLNFHYIKPLHRVFFMDELYKYLGTRFNEPVFRIDYQKLMARRSLKYYRPCIKRYLFKNISQKISIIEPEDWELALFLPTEKFIAEGDDTESTTRKEKIWEKSAKLIKKI